jgi:two-component system response regulator (stage 0 sporulation protein F)
LARILITDDEAGIRFLMRLYLEADGHQTFLAGNGVEALALARLHPIDLLICDLFMPLMDGFETIREFRSTWPGVPILVISGGGCGPCDGMDVLAQANYLGADRTLGKPFSRDELRNAVHEALSRVVPCIPAAAACSKG